MAFSPGGKLIATADQDGTARLWNVATQSQVGSALVDPSAPFPLLDVAFSPNGQFLATADNHGTVRIWDVATHRQIGTAITATATGAARGVAFSPDGELLATTGDDNTLRLWDVATHGEIGSAIVVPEGATTMMFSPNGRLLATAGGPDGIARLWDMAFPRNLPAAMCSIAGTGNSLTHAQWDDYIQQPYLQPCP